MAFSEAQDIINAVSAFQNDTMFKDRQTRWETDFNLWRLKAYDAGKGYYSYTTNMPRVFADKVISMLTNSKLLIQIPEELLTDAEQHTASNVERFWYGCFNMNDEMLLLMPQRSKLLGQMAWHACLRGGFGLLVYAHKTEDGNTFPMIRVWDLYNMAYGFDSKGITWAANKYKIPREQADKEYGVTATSLSTSSIGNLVDCIDYWDREKYGLIVGGKLVNEFTPHKLDYCPVAVLGAGSLPPVWQENYLYTGTHIGESIFGAARGIFPAMSKTFSDLVTIIRRGVKVPMGLWTATGTTGKITEDVFQVDKAAIIEFREGEDFKPLLPQSMPADTGNAINIMMGEAQRGTFPHTVYGELGFRLSGFAINQLQTSIATIVVPFSECIERAYNIACLWLLKQYTTKSLPAIKVRGRTAKDMAFGYPKAVQIKPTELEGDWHPEVKLVQVFPKDDAQRYQ